jgi:beta-lactam-binding protein with PASTA domain
LGIAPNTDDTALVTVPNYKNSTVDYAKRKIEEELGVKCVVRGNGDKVTHQLPASGTVIYNDGVVILYTDGADVEANATVPNLVDKSPSAAIKSLINNNLNVSISGIFNNDFKNCKVISQSVPAGEKVLPGTVIELEFLYEESIE